MPRLYSGANPDPGDPIFTFLSLTRYQMAHIENWVNGNFDADWPGSAPTPTPFEKFRGAPGVGAVRSRARDLRRRTILSGDRGHL